MIGGPELNSRVEETTVVEQYEAQAVDSTAENSPGGDRESSASS